MSAQRPSQYQHKSVAFQVQYLRRLRSPLDLRPDRGKAVFLLAAALLTHPFLWVLHLYIATLDPAGPQIVTNQAQVPVEGDGHSSAANDSTFTTVLYSPVPVCFTHVASMISLSSVRTPAFIRQSATPAQRLSPSAAFPFI